LFGIIGMGGQEGPSAAGHHFNLQQNKFTIPSFG
jgi:hypothetical protein